MVYLTTRIFLICGTEERREKTDGGREHDNVKDSGFLRYETIRGNYE